jgi:outer membrane lipopolysaccharide assembly protein LptE/RlpB
MANKSRRSFIKITFISAFFALLVACGYTFAPQGENIDKSIRKIYVEQFDNKTAQAEVENYVRQAFINQFIQNTRFKITGNAESADATVRGGILNLSMTPLSYRSNTMAAEERATMTLEITFRETQSSKIIWSSRSITGFVDYTIDNNINLLPATRKTALTQMANDIAEKTLNQMMSGF